MRLILEPRFLFDGSVGATAHPIHDAAHDSGHESDHVTPRAVADADPRPPAAANDGASHPGDDRRGTGSDVPGDRAPRTEPGSQDALPPRSVGAVLFVDPRVSNWQTLAAGTAPGTKVIVLDPTTDGIAQVSGAMAGLRDVTTINFLTYGSAGQIQLGSSNVDAAALLANADAVAGWRDHMADNAQIMLWGCDAGGGSAGAALVADLHALTGVGVAASTDATGTAALGGNWALERTAGDVRPIVPFSAAAIAAFQNVLDAPVPTVTFTNVPSQVLLGDTFSETITFTNAAASGVGYGPAIEVFAPHNVLDVATLSSATFLGNPLPFATIELTTTVPGHAGILGALVPTVLDGSGNPVFVTAPAGMVAGDMMYGIELPFGSFTPGQPGASVVLNFATTDTSVLTAQHGGQQLNINAIGAFIYGADPLENPATDPPIQGTSGGLLSGITPANGEVTASSSLVLATVTTSVVTPPGEGETATGPDFVSDYRVTITAAPATVGNPITNTTIQIALPDNIQYTGDPITISGSAGTATFVPGPSAQGGSVTVTFASVSASAGPTVVDIPFFVPLNDANGAPVLDPVTGAPTTVASPSVDYGPGTWNPAPGSADFGSPFTVAGSATGGADFNARSLAVQQSALDLVTGSASQTFPDDEIQYKVSFQVSDFFAMGALSVQTLLGDGVVIDPTVAPILTVTPAGGSPTSVSLGALAATSATVNGELVPISGGNANWSFINFNAPGAPGSLGAGQTEVDLHTALALLLSTGSTALSAGETGTLTFNARVLDKYTNTNIDPVTNAPASITELDTVSSITSATATVLTTAGVPTATPSVSISDGSSNTLTVPKGTGSVFVAAINGVAVPGAATVNAGDEVTYALTRTLSTGDYQSLDLSAFLPLPVLNAADPASNGNIVTSYTLDSSQAGASTFYPGLGMYSFFVAPTPGGGAPAYSVQSADVTALSNSISFALGHRDDPTNVHDQTVTVYFTVKASTAPFADGLQLTIQGGTSLANGHGASNSTEDIDQITVAEPNLVNQSKDGIASIVNDAGVPKPGPFTVDGTSTPGDPTGFYDPALTPVADGLFLNFLGPTAQTDLQNLNVAGADGGDTVRIVTTVVNSGSGNGGAYDIVVSDTLPNGYTVADVSNLTMVRSGTLTTLVPQTGSLLNLFTAGGVTLEAPTSTEDTPQPTLYTASDLINRNVLTISFDLKLHADQAAGTVLTNTSTLLNYTNIFNGVALGNGFVVNGNPIGGSPADLIDTATITTTAPTLAKTFAASDIPQNDNVDPSFPNATVVVGETRPVTITVTLPEGVINNGASDVFVTEQLPADEIFTGLISITGSSGVSFTLPGTPFTVSGNLVTFDLGPQVLNANADASGTVNITYTARFADGVNLNNTQFTSTANLIYSGAPVAPARVTFIEHDPILAATLTDNTGGTVFSDELVTYTYTLTNSGLVEAQSTGATLDLPAGLTYVPGTLKLVSQAGTPDSVNAVDDGLGAAGTLKTLPGVFDPSGTLVYSFQAKVSPGLAIGTDLTVTSPTPGNSALSIVNAFARPYTFSASDPMFVAAIIPTLYFAAEANGTSTVAPGTASTIDMTIGDIARLHGVARTPEGSNSGTVLDFTLPAGFVPYAADGTVALALVSPNGSMTSSQLDPSGTLPGLQVTNGPGFDAATFAPTFAVPLSAIDTTTAPGHLLVNLGTVANDAGSPLPNYVIVEFNAQLQNVASNHAGVTLTEQFAVQASGITTPSASRSERVAEPTVTLAKMVTAIDPAAGTATYLITLTNSGLLPAYNVSLTDPLPASNVGSVSAITPAGGAVGLTVTPGGTDIFTASMTLPAGATETFIYTLTVGSATLPVPATTSSETFQDINPAVTGLTFNGFTSAIGAVGSATGSRDGSSIPGAGINNYWAQVTTSLGTASGVVWQALGNTPSVFDGAIDTPLPGVTVTINASGLTQTTTTAVDGGYLAGLIPNGIFTVGLPASGASGLPANETLIVNPFGSLTAPGLASATATGTALTGINFVYELPDTQPVLGNWASGTRTILPSQVTALSTTGAATAADTELDMLVGAHPATYSYAGTVLTVQRYIGGATAANSADVFGGDAQLSLSGGVVALSGTTVGGFTQSGGLLSITFNSTATVSSVQGVLDHLTYSNATVGTLALNLTIGAALSDANFNTVPLATGSTGAQGTGGVKTSAPVFSVFTLLPASSSYTASFIEPNNTAAAGSAITLPAATLANLIAPGATLSDVRVTLGGGTVAAEDVLAFVASGATGNITGSFDAGTGTLTMVSGGASATITQWQAALGAIQYYDSSDQPHTAIRDVTYSLTSTAGGGTATEVLGQIAVSATNDSPILNNAVILSLPHANEDGFAVPSGAVGTLASTLANSGDITDPDGNNAHDGGATGPVGLSVVAADTTVGNWWYSTNGGATWTEFDGAGLPAISAANALHLVADANSRIYFQPTVPDFNGGVTPALTIRAWDLFDGATNGSLAALPTDGPLGTGVNLLASAHSSATISMGQAVDPVNDAPVAAGTATLAPAAEDTASPPGATVGSLFTANFSDPIDQQRNLANPTGSVSDTLAGVAITGNTAPASEGVWRYSTDNGVSWTVIPLTVSDAAALILPVSARLGFLPAADFNGVPPPLTARVIDSSTDVPVTGAVTGQALQGGTAAFSNVDVSGANNGGITAVSAATVPLLTAVPAVNDAPVAAGTATLAPAAEDTASPPGATVGSLFTATFSDTADQQRSGVNPTGSVSDTLAGVAITGNTAPASEGVWRYSMDNGVSWTVIPLTVSDAAALILPVSARLGFLPAADFNGVPPPLTARVIDSSTDVPVTGAVTGLALQGGTAAFSNVDVSGANNGGITAVSAATVPLLTAVPAVNDAPVAAGTATLAPAAEDTASPPGATVGSLFAANFSDPIDQQRNLANPTGSVSDTLAGVAITGNTAPSSEGVWRYSTDNGVSWTVIPLTVSDAAALILPVSARLGFLPAADFNGVPPPLTTRVIDGSTDVPVTGAVTGQALQGGTAAFSNVDVSGANNGGITAVSAATVPLLTAMPAVNDAPVAAGTATLAPAAEDTASPPGDTVGSLFTATFSDTADQQRSGVNPTGSVSDTLAGVAITGNTAPASEGVWRYSTDNGVSWTVIPLTVSDAAALILPVSARLGFLPAADFNGVPPPLTARVIDSSTDVPITGGVTGQALQSGTAAFSNVDVSGANNGGITAVSAATVPLLTAVPAVNDAPVAAGTATLAPAAEDTASPPGATVGSLFAANFSDPIDQQRNLANPTGSVSDTLAGVAITGNTTPVSEGAWRYSTDNGVSWTVIPLTVSDAAALILPVSARIGFLPAADFNGVPPPLTARVIDSSTDVPVTGAVTGLALQGGTAAFSNVDVSGANNGGITAVSAATVPLLTAVPAVNDAPIAAGTATLAPAAEDTASPPGATVGSLFTANFSDPIDQQRNLANPTGSVSDTLAGVAITGNTAPASEGAWRYSTDNGVSWTVIPLTVSDAAALILPVSARLGFLPAADFNGTPPPLTARVIDGSTDVPVTGAVTGQALQGGTAAFSNVDVSGANNGGITAVSAATVPLLTAMPAVNDAPVAAGTATLAPAAEDTASPPGDTVGSLFTATFSDTADQQRSGVNPTGSVSDTLAGVAITGNTAPASEGVWRYSTDNGVSWTVIPLTVSDAAALVLPVSARIGFLPAADFNGAPPPLTARVIDSSTDVPITGAVTGLALQGGAAAFSNVDVSGANNGGITAVSAATVPLLTAVPAVNDAPIAAGTATLPDITATEQQPSGDTIANLFTANFSDMADQQQSAANPAGSRANALAGVIVIGDTTAATDGTWRYSTDGGANWVVISTDVSDSNGLVLGSLVKLAFVPNPSFSGTPPPLQVRLIDTSTDIAVAAGGLTGAQIAGTVIARAGVDVSTTHHGGITSVSDAIVPVTINVIRASNPELPHNPVFPQKPTNPFEPLDRRPGDGGLAPGWLVGTTVYRSLTTGRRGDVNVSADAFYGSDTAQKLTYEAGTASGGPLPPWLSFDPTTLSFTGVPPDNAAGTLDLRVLARDTVGHQAVAEVHLFITRDTTDLLQLLRSSRALRQINRERAAPTPPSHPPPVMEPPAKPATPPPNAPGGAALPSPAGEVGRNGFTAQLRDQTLAGRLARSRAMLTALSSGAT